LPAVACTVLVRVDAELRRATTIDDRRLTRIAAHLLDAGGKRLRPTLVVACALAAGGSGVVSQRVVDAAVAVELAHLASLYHDDVLDAAELRRGQPSANALWGNELAVLGGDVLLAHAYRVASDLGPEALRRLSDTMIELCSGQVAETDRQFDGARAIADYELAIRGKTAALLATSCWLGAVAVDEDPMTADALSRYGAEVGMAFQIVDDLLDLCGDSGVIGKATGSDLRGGVFTLPELLAVADDASLVDLLTRGITDEDIAEVGRRVRASGADQLAGHHALAHVQAAQAQLTALQLDPEGESMLSALAEMVMGPLGFLRLQEAQPTDAVTITFDV
jgi:heptaprenyl diphosphate synthase